MGLTQCVRQQLKNHGWNVEQAIDAYVYLTFIYYLNIKRSISALLLYGILRKCYWLWITLLKDGLGVNLEHTGCKSLATGKMGGYDIARASRESNLHEARAAAERNIARIHRESGAELDDEEVSRQLLSIEDTRPFNYSLASVTDEDKIPTLGGHQSRRSPSSHSKKLAPLFMDWCDKAVYMEGGIKSEKLPLMFRFALKRLLMPESTLQKTLKEFEIDPTLGFLSDMRVAHTLPHGKDRRTMYGLDPDPTQHVSSKYRNAFPKDLSLLDYEDQGLAEEMNKWLDILEIAETCGIGTGWESGSRRHDVELNRQQLHECLWSLYDLVQDGLVDFEEASGRYRDVLGKPDLTTSDLMSCLRALGLPDHHIQNVDSIESMTPGHDVEEKRIIKEITDLVGLHIFGGFRVTEVLALIKDTLIGLPFDVPSLYNMIQNHSGDAASVAERIWDETAGRDPGAGDKAKDGAVPSQPVSEEFKEICETVLRADLTAEDALAMLEAAIGEHELSGAQKSHIFSNLDSSRTVAYRRIFDSNADHIEGSGNSHTAMRVPRTIVEEDFSLFPDELSQDFQAPGLGISSTVDSSQDPSRTLSLEKEKAKTSGTDGHSEERLQYSVSKDAADTIAAEKSPSATPINVLVKRTDVLPTTVSVGHTSRRPLDSSGVPTVVMPPPASTAPKIKMIKNSASRSKSVLDRPRTPIPVPKEINQEEATDGAWKPYVSDDDIYDIGYLSSSPEKGVTSDLFGLSMPTSKARELGAKLGLPSDYIHNQIHSETPRRMNTKKFNKASRNVTFSSRKRKASGMLNGSHRDKAPKHGAPSGLFAQDGEDHEKFVHGYFMWEVLQGSKNRCSSYQRLQCACKKRKRSSGSQGARNRKRPPPPAPARNTQPAATKRSLSDSTASSKASFSSSSLGIIRGGAPNATSKPVDRIQQAKLRLNPPKPSEQPNPMKLPSPSLSQSPPSAPELSSSPSPPSSPELSSSPSPPSSLSGSTHSSSPSLSILTNQMRPPKALLSNLKQEMADQNVVDALNRLLEAEAPEGTLHQLVNHALHLISEQIRTEGPKFSDSKDISNAQPVQTLRHLIEAELLAKRTTEELSQQPESQSDGSSGFRAPLGEVLENVTTHREITHSETMPSIEQGIDPNSRPMTRDKNNPRTLSDIYTSKDKEMSRRSRSSLPRQPALQQASDTAATRALLRNPATGYIEQKRRGEGYHPWPERGISTKDAIDKAHEEARRQRKGIFLYMAERRLIRPRANQSQFDRFYQGGSSSKPSSGAGITSSLNKLFDKYRGQLPFSCG